MRSAELLVRNRPLTAGQLATANGLTSGAIRASSVTWSRLAGRAAALTRPTATVW